MKRFIQATLVVFFSLSILHAQENKNVTYLERYSNMDWRTDTVQYAKIHLDFDLLDEQYLAKIRSLYNLKELIITDRKDIEDCEYYDVYISKDSMKNCLTQILTALPKPEKLRSLYISIRSNPCVFPEAINRFENLDELVLEADGWWRPKSQPELEFSLDKAWPKRHFGVYLPPKLAKKILEHPKIKDLKELSTNTEVLTKIKRLRISSLEKLCLLNYISPYNYSAPETNLKDLEILATKCPNLKDLRINLYFDKIDEKRRIISPELEQWLGQLESVELPSIDSESYSYDLSEETTEFWNKLK